MGTGAEVGFVVDMAVLRASAKGVAMEEWTIIRSVDMQIWPLCYG